MRLQQFSFSLLVALLACLGASCSQDLTNDMLYDTAPSSLQAAMRAPSDHDDYPLLPLLSAKYRQTPAAWYGLRDPTIFLLNDPDHQGINKRTIPSLSIVNPLDVLRQRLMLEMARRQMRENSKQVLANREMLKNIGKRSARGFYANSPSVLGAQPQQHGEEGGSVDEIGYN